MSLWKWISNAIAFMWKFKCSAVYRCCEGAITVTGNSAANELWQKYNKKSTAHDTNNTPLCSSSCTVLCHWTYLIWPIDHSTTEGLQQVMLVAKPFSECLALILIGRKIFIFKIEEDWTFPLIRKSLNQENVLFGKYFTVISRCSVVYPTSQVSHSCCANWMIWDIRSWTSAVLTTGLPPRASRHSDSTPWTEN